MLIRLDTDFQRLSKKYRYLNGCLSQRYAFRFSCNQDSSFLDKMVQDSQ